MSVASQGSFVHTCHYPLYKRRTLHLREQFYVNVWDFFFYLTQSRVWLVWTSVRFLFDCDPISLGFNMLHCDLASVVDQTAIFMWSNWVRLGFSGHFSVSFFECTFYGFLCAISALFCTISTRFPYDFSVISRRIQYNGCLCALHLKLHFICRPSQDGNKKWPNSAFLGKCESQRWLSELTSEFLYFSCFFLFKVINGFW